ncbi:acetyl-CoA carboxylase biotin carboxyl carrier protein [Caloramator sp. E03]|uniref:acetyl-CoA carboxylase biotin carboxyl carrier protein n=1 Tax=Caloramator sp. E03 TaxID=2576307 RepID=UPI001110173B|nr:acetyl-CoA carboxylase biotin carboxyl carrier protein [Caloramator sp. E03]QCX33797.1 acetyl-CoA carboxylase biotin carboxyl carrier protein [Caloramator sp. E03]
MELKDIKEIIREIDSSSISEFEFQKDNIRIVIKRNNTVKYVNYDLPKEESLFLVAEDKDNDEKDTLNDIYIIKSPIVGTFYSAPNPEAKPYVTVGSKVKKGDVLCIVEAMKLMNEITSDVDGEIVEIMVQNGSFIEYGQPLFGVRKV